MIPIYRIWVFGEPLEAPPPLKGEFAGDALYAPNGPPNKAPTQPLWTLSF